MAKGVWGIDVSRYSLKAVRLEAGRQGVVLTDMEVLPYGFVGKVQEAELESRIRESLQQLKFSKKIRGEGVVLSLPTHSHYNRLVKLPPFGDMEMAVQHEARQQIPIPLEEAIWGFQIVERQYQPGEEKDVILLAIKKDTVDGFLKIVDDVGFNIDQIQLSPVGVYNFLTYDQESSAATVLLELGAENGSLIVVENDRFWVRNLPLAGNDVTKAISETFGIPFDKAEQLKIKALDSPQAERIYDSILPVYKNIVSEIHRSLGYYKSISKQAKFDRVVLLGNGTKSLNFQRFIGQALQIQAVKLQKLNKIALAPDVDSATLANHLSSIATALGLALQGCGLTRNSVNLLPETYRLRKEFRKKYPFVGAGLAVLFAALALSYKTTGDRIDSINALTGGIQQVPKEALKVDRSYQDAKNAVPPIETQVGLLGKIGVDRSLMRNILEEVLKNFPDNSALAAQDKEKVWLMDLELIQWDGDKPARGAGAIASGPALMQLRRTLSFRMVVAITRFLVDKVGADASGAVRGPEEGAKFIREKLALSKLKILGKDFPAGQVVVAPDGTADNIKLPEGGTGPGVPGGVRTPDENDKFLKYVVRFEVDVNK